MPEIPGVIEHVTAVFVHRTSVEDRYGNKKAKDETKVPPETRVPGCLFEPEQSTERTDTRSPGVTTPAKLYTPGPAPDSDDLVQVNGKTWEVIGTPASWGDAGAEVALKRWGK